MRVEHTVVVGFVFFFFRIEFKESVVASVVIEFFLFFVLNEVIGEQPCADKCGGSDEFFKHWCSPLCVGYGIPVL